MSLEDELEPKVNEISRLALERYAELLRGTGFKLDGNGSIVVNPDEPSFRDDPPKIHKQREDVWRENWRVFNDLLNEVLYRFRAFYRLDPLDFTTMLSRLGGTRRGVAPADGRPTSVHDRLTHADDQWVSRVEGMIKEGHWDGPAADTFDDDFLQHFHRAVEQQKAYVRELGLVAQSYHDAAAAAGKDLGRIADACIARLKGRHDDSEWITDLSVVSIIAGALSLFPPIATVAGVVSLGAGITGFVASEGASGDQTPERLRIDGHEPRAIIQSTWVAILGIEGLLGDLDDALGRGLNQDLQGSSSFASPGLRLPRPDVADHPDQFGRMNVGNPPGVPLAKSPVVASIVDLYRAGYVNLPGAAYEYDQAAAKLGSCTIAQPLARFFPRSIPLFHEARDVLEGILRNTSDSLAGAGHALVQVATSYHLTDEENAEAMRRIHAIPPSFGEEGGTPLHGPV
jgi:hypothetical protein